MPRVQVSILGRSKMKTKGEVSDFWFLATILVGVIVLMGVLMGIHGNEETNNTARYTITDLNSNTTFHGCKSIRLESCGGFFSCNGGNISCMTNYEKILEREHTGSICDGISNDDWYCTTREERPNDRICVCQLESCACRTETVPVNKLDAPALIAEDVQVYAYTPKPGYGIATTNLELNPDANNKISYVKIPEIKPITMMKTPDWHLRDSKEKRLVKQKEVLDALVRTLVAYEVKPLEAVTYLEMLKSLSLEILMKEYKEGEV